METFAKSSFGNLESFNNLTNIYEGAEVTVPKLNIDTSAFDSVLFNSHESKLKDLTNLGNTQTESEVNIWQK